MSGSEINNSEKETVLESFPLLTQQLIEAFFYDAFKHRPTLKMICDFLEQNNFNIISLSQQEIEDVLKLIGQYRQNIINDTLILKNIFYYTFYITISPFLLKVMIMIFVSSS